MVQYGARETPQMSFTRDFNKEKNTDLNGLSVNMANIDHQ